MARSVVALALVLVVLSVATGGGARMDGDRPDTGPRPDCSPGQIQQGDGSCIAAPATPTPTPTPTGVTPTPTVSPTATSTPLPLPLGGTGTDDASDTPAGQVLARVSGKISDITVPQAVIPGLDTVHVDPDGTDSSDYANGAGSFGKPFEHVTGPDSALDKLIAQNRAGFATCAEDASTGCGRCSDDDSACNENSDCTAGVCTDKTCSSSSAEACAFHCSVTTSQHCLFDGHCPDTEECHDGTCSITTATTCNDDGDCPVTETCTLNTTKNNNCTTGGDTCVTTNASSACNGGTCTGADGRPAIFLNPGEYNELLGPCDETAADCRCKAVCTGGSNPGVVCPNRTECLGGGTCDTSDVCDPNDPTNRCPCDPTSIGSGGFRIIGAGKYDSVIRPTANIADTGRGCAADLSHIADTFFSNLHLSVIGTAAVACVEGDAHNVQFDNVVFSRTGTGDQYMLKVGGRGARTIACQGCEFFGNGDNTAAQCGRFETQPVSVCLNDATRKCLADTDCAASICVERMCWGDPSIPCGADSDCTGADVCVADVVAERTDVAPNGASIDMGVLGKPSFLQCGKAGGTSLLFTDKAGGGIQNVVAEQVEIVASDNNHKRCDTDADGHGDPGGTTCTVDGDCTPDTCKAVQTRGLVLEPGTCNASGAGCPRQQVQGGNIIVRGSSAYGAVLPPDVSIRVGEKADLLAVATLDYDASRRELGGTCDTADAGAIIYENSETAGQGASYLGPLATDPNCPQDDERWQNTTQGLAKWKHGGTVYEWPLATYTTNPTTAHGGIHVWYDADGDARFTWDDGVTVAGESRFETTRGVHCHRIAGIGETICCGRGADGQICRAAKNPDGTACTTTGCRFETMESVDDKIANVDVDHIDAITEIAALLRSGADGELITGTPGSTDNCAKWNADGDLVDHGSGCGGSAADTVSATDTTFGSVNPVAWNTANTEIFDDTAPSITTDEDTNTILVAVTIAGDADDNADAYNGGFKVVVSTSSNPACTGTQVGQTFNAGWTTNSTGHFGAAATFLYAPATAGTYYFSVCTTGTGVDDGDVTAIAIVLVEHGA